MLTETMRSDSEEALARLRAHIARAGYGVGDRLPPERQLTETLGMSRVVLRRALDSLERDGVIWRHVGKGTFVASAPGDGGGDNAVSALARRMTPTQMMRARACIEPALAREAAINASGDAITRMRVEMDRARTAGTWRDYESQDDRFHRAIAAAGENALLLALFDQLSQVRRAVAGGRSERKTAQPSDAHPSFAEHEAIVDAIADRAHEAAEAAMREHLRRVADRLFT
ncbi:FadR family transcriptional regulator [Rhodobacteraceae bacterium WD3A24]|nr:FadR family transcriptional regulator [Rhodobacteraceae bacterium WD3A24]